LKCQLPEESIDLSNGELSRFRALCHAVDLFRLDYNALYTPWRTHSCGTRTSAYATVHCVNLTLVGGRMTPSTTSGSEKLATDPAVRPTRGSLWAIFLYDVAESIDLGKLRSTLGIVPASREPRFKHPAPDYVRFEQPPLEQSVAAPALVSGEQLQARIKYFDYGVIAVELELPFETPFDRLIERSSQWIGA